MDLALAQMNLTLSDINMGMEDTRTEDIQLAASKGIDEARATAIQVTASDICKAVNEVSDGDKLGDKEEPGRLLPERVHGEDERPA